MRKIPEYQKEAMAKGLREFYADPVRSADARRKISEAKKKWWNEDGGATPAAYSNHKET
jgi:hypothetical protein